MAMYVGGAGKINSEINVTPLVDVVFVLLIIFMVVAPLLERGYDLDVGLGIAKGFATIGAIGFEGRWDYGAIGSVTNIANRLCAEASTGQILVTERICAGLGDRVDAELVGDLALKGLSHSVTAFSIRGLR